MRRFVSLAVTLALAACGSGSSGVASLDGDAGADATTDAATPAVDGGGGDGASTTDGGGSTDGAPGTDGGPAAGDIGTWTDAPGACPAGTTKIDVTTLADLASATRADGAHAADPADACYLIHDGTYTQSGATLPFLVQKGGASTTQRRIFIGQSRGGTRIVGRGAIADGVSHVVVQNLTFDLTGYSQSGSFNTFDLFQNDDVLVSHVTFTGDCNTGANGGHVEFTNTSNSVLDSCLIEKFGRCGPLGHQDHGIYIAHAKNVTVQNCDIRGNASRGIQMYTQQGAYGTLDGITITRNRIHDNGHADYEDGIVLNGGQTGTITNVTIEHNLVYGNYYSGIRTVDVAYTNVVARKNTLYGNGVGSTAAGRGEVVLDSAGSGANETFTKNILFATAQATNSCYDATARAYLLTDNLVQGTVPAGLACVTASVTADPGFANAPKADFHTANAAALGYGAYAP